jgi:hypothetical protein
MAVGRISGPLLKDNLLRNGVDLAFETNLLYLDVANRRIGVNTSAPTNDLTVNGSTRSTNLTATTSATLGTFTFSGNTLSSSSNTINLLPSGVNPVVYQGTISVGNLNISGNTIAGTGTNTDLEITTTGDGTIEVNSSVNIYGNLHATGTITADGDITLGNSAVDDTVTFGAEIASNLVPDSNNVYTLGTDPTAGGNAWKNLYAYSLSATNFTASTLTVNNDLEVTGTATLNGTIQLGTSSADTVNVVGSFINDLIPATTATYDLGSPDYYWNNVYATTTTVGSLSLSSNIVSTNTTNTDLKLIPNGTGLVSVPSNNVQIDQNLTVGQNLTVTSGLSSLKAVTIVGAVGLTGDINQTGTFTTSGNTAVTGNITTTGYLQLPNITVNGNTVSTSNSNLNLVLSANGTGSVQIQSIAVNNNVISSVGTNANITLTPQGTGSVVINSNQSFIIPVGTTLERPTGANGMVRYNTTTARYEGFSGSYWTNLGGVQSVDGLTRITPELNPGTGDNIIRFYANNILTVTIDSSKLYTNDFQTNNLDISSNTISALTSNTDIKFSTAGTGGVVIGNIKITSNTFTNIVANAVTQFNENGTGYVKVAGTYGVVIPVGDVNNRPLTLYREPGMIRFNTDLQLVEVFNGNTWSSVAGSSSGVTSSTAQDIGVQTALALG